MRPNPWYYPASDQPSPEIYSGYSSGSLSQSSTPNSPHVWSHATSQTSLHTTKREGLRPSPSVLQSSRPLLPPRSPPRTGHRASKSDSGHNGSSRTDHGSKSCTSLPGINHSNYVGSMAQELADMTVRLEEMLTKFQSGSLPDKDEEWHILVPPEARSEIDKAEFQRQSALFELIKWEKGYLSDLILLREIYIRPLSRASPPIISPETHLQAFLTTVFGNLDQIIFRHERLLAQLFTRQREQHPFIQSVCNIISEFFCQTREDYGQYIKQYPLAEQRHKTEHTHNPKYHDFVQRCSLDPRVRKRDLTTFLQRPFIRLPRLNLLLGHVLKFTEEDHPDHDSLQALRFALADFLNGIQSEIGETESKARLWDLMAGLDYNDGEIVELDFDNASRSFVHAGMLARRRSDADWNPPWSDLYVVLLDNSLLITKEEKTPAGAVKYLVLSRPIPLAFLRLGTFDGTSETRKERLEGGGILLRGSYRPVYPFTVYHAFEKSTRSYTLYADSEEARRKWHTALIEAKTVDDVSRTENPWFVLYDIDDSFFRVPKSHTRGNGISGRVLQAVSFSAMEGQKFMAVACAYGVYVSRIQSAQGKNFRRIFSFGDVKAMIVLQDFNRILIHDGFNLVSYSLEILARLLLYLSPASALDATHQHIADNVDCCMAAKTNGQTKVVYAVRDMLNTTINVVLADEMAGLPHSFHHHAKFYPPPREHGAFYVPGEAYAVTTLENNIAVCTKRGIALCDLQKKQSIVVPCFTDTRSRSAMADLKTRCEGARALGIIRRNQSEFVVIYDTMGCCITPRGDPIPGRNFIVWDVKADSFLHRGEHVLLFSSEFIEVRHLQSGKLAQVIEGADIRLLHTPSAEADPPLVGLRGKMDDAHGLSERIAELHNTVDLAPVTLPSSYSVPSNGWDEWDM